VSGFAATRRGGTCNRYVPMLLAATELGLECLERELSCLLESMCLLDADLKPRRDTIDPEFEDDAIVLERAIAEVRAVIAEVRGGA